MPPQHQNHRHSRGGHHHHRHPPPQDRGRDGDGPSSRAVQSRPPKATGTDGTATRAAAAAAKSSSDRRSQEIAGRSGEEPAERGGGRFGGDDDDLGRNKRRQWERGGDRCRDPECGAGHHGTGAVVATTNPPTTTTPTRRVRPAGRVDGAPSYLSPTKSSRRRSRPAAPSPNGVVGGMGGGGDGAITAASQAPAPASRSTFVFGAAGHSPDRGGLTTKPSPRKRRSGGVGLDTSSGGGTGTSASTCDGGGDDRRRRRGPGEAHHSDSSPPARKSSGQRIKDDRKMSPDDIGGDRGGGRRLRRHRSHPSDEGRALDDSSTPAGGEEDGSTSTPLKVPPSFPGGATTVREGTDTSTRHRLGGLSSPQLSLFATPPPPKLTTTNGGGALSPPSSSPRIRGPPAPISSEERPALRVGLGGDGGGPAAENFRRDLDDVLDRWTELRGELLQILPSSSTGGGASSRTNGDGEDEAGRRRHASSVLARVREMDDGLRRLGERAAAAAAIGHGTGSPMRDHGVGAIDGQRVGGGFTLRRTQEYSSSEEEEGTATTYPTWADGDGEVDEVGRSGEFTSWDRRSTTKMIPKTASSPGMKFVMELSESIGLDAGQHLLLSDIMDRHCVSLPEGGERGVMM